MPDNFSHKGALSWGQAVIVCGQMAAYQFIKLLVTFSSAVAYLPELCLPQKDMVKFSKFSSIEQVFYI